MLVNFLPLDTLSQSDCSSVLSSEQTNDSLDSVVEEENSRIRTQEWVSCLSNASYDVGKVNNAVGDAVADVVADVANEESLLSPSKMD